MITIVDLIRRSGREPGGGYPKGYVETWTFKKGKREAIHRWEPARPMPRFEFMQPGLAVRDPAALKRIHPFSLVDAAKHEQKDLLYEMRDLVYANRNLLSEAEGRKFLASHRC